MLASFRKRCDVKAAPRSLTRRCALRLILSKDRDAVVLELAARAMGRLARASTTADIADDEVKRALDWLQKSEDEHELGTAALVLRELAHSMPTQFNVHAEAFLTHVW